MSEELRPGMKFRSLRLADYTMTLVRPTGHEDWWIIEPGGSSAHGRYTARASHLLDPAACELEAFDA